MQRLVFTIVAGFFGGSGSADDLVPVQRGRAEDAAPALPAGAPHRSPRPQDESGPAGVNDTPAAGEAKGFA